MANAPPGPWAQTFLGPLCSARGAEIFSFETMSRGSKRQTGTSGVMTVQIKCWRLPVPIQHPTWSPIL